MSFNIQAQNAIQRMLRTLLLFSLFMVGARGLASTSETIITTEDDYVPPDGGWVSFTVTLDVKKGGGACITLWSLWSYPGYGDKDSLSLRDIKVSDGVTMIERISYDPSYAPIGFDKSEWPTSYAGAQFDVICDNPTVTVSFYIDSNYTSEIRRGGVSIVYDDIYSSSKVVSALWMQMPILNPPPSEDSDVCKVTLDPRGGSLFHYSAEYKKGSAIGKLETPSWYGSGYEFAGWYDAAGKEVTSSYVVTQDCTFYARWNVIVFTVVFGDVERKYEYFSPIGEMPIPTQSRYEFCGWTTRHVGYEKIVTEDTLIQDLVDWNMVDQDLIDRKIRLIAIWRGPFVSVSLNAQGGSVSPGTIQLCRGEPYGELPEPIRNGYLFLGWYTASSGGDRIQATTKVNTSSDHAMYAHWIPNDPTLSDIGVASANSSVNLGSWHGGYDKCIAKSRSAAAPLLAIWCRESTSQEVQGIGCTANQNIRRMIVSDDFVKWRTGGSSIGKLVFLFMECASDFSSNGGNGYGSDTAGAKWMGTTEVPSLKIYWEAPDGTVVNKSFRWHKDADYSDSLVVDLINEIENQLKSLIRKVEFDPNGGECDIKSQLYAEAGSYGFLPDPKVREKYFFDGWYTAAVGGSRVTEASRLSSNSAQTLHAHWSAKEYCISFDSNGGGCVESSRSVSCVAAVGALPTPTLTHHDFLGWFTEKDGGTQITERSIVTKDLTVYAHWKLTEYPLQFNANGGTCAVKSSAVGYGLEYGALPTPEMTGYTFAGWFTAQTGGSAVSASDRMLTEGATVYAHWTMNKYSIGFDANGGEGAGDAISLRYDTAFTLPKSGYTRLGYKLDGWTTSQGGAKMFEPGASVSKLTAEANGTVTLYAVWIPVPLTASYARQHYPWNGLADVVAKVEGDAGVNYQVSFQVADADGEVKPVVSIHAVGQTQIQRVQTLANGEYAFVWDVANDLAAGYKSSGLKMRAVAYDKDAQEVSHSDWVSMGTVNLGDVAGRVAGKQPLAYGADWVSGGAKSVIKANGTVIAELTGKGVFEWTGEAGQTYTLTLEILNSSGVRVGDVYSVTWEWVTQSVLTFIGNIDGVGPQTRVYDDTYAYGEFPHVEKSCYDFLGWFTSATGGSRVRETDVSNGNKTLYGHWQASGYQIVFDANGGTGEMSSQVIRTGEKTALAECTYGVSDSACIGWSMTPDGPVQFKNGEEVLDLVPITKDLKLYAVWALEDVDLKSFRQRYPWNGLVDIDFELTGVAGRDYTLLVQVRDNVGGTNLNVRTVLDDQLSAKENPLVASAGTHRIVWNADADLSDGFKCDDVSMRLAFVTTVEFDACGGQCDVAAKQYVLGDPYGQLPIPMKPGCVFKGWYGDAEYKAAVTVGSLAGPSVAVLYAKWETEQ